LVVGSDLPVLIRVAADACCTGLRVEGSVKVVRDEGDARLDVRRGVRGELRPDRLGAGSSGLLHARRTLDGCQDRAAEAIAVHIAGLQSDKEQISDQLGTPQPLTVTVAA